MYSNNEPLSSPTLAPIKFIPRQEASLTVPSTHELEEDLARIKGIHRKKIADEIRLMFRSFLRNGYFKFDTNVVKFIYNQDFYRKLLKTIQPFTKVIKDAHRGECCHRVFLLKGIESTSSECITYSERQCYSLFPSNELLTYRTIEPEFLNYRYEKWSEYCDLHGLENNVDFDGRTKWGAILLETQRSLLVPLVAPEPDDRREYDESDKAAYRQHVQNRLDKYQAGIPNFATKKHGRAYHATTGNPIEVRRQMLIDGERTTEIDLSATYWALLISLMDECEEKEELKQIVQSEAGFYSIFDFSVLPEFITPKGSTKRVRVNRKVEVMKHCLFLNSNKAMPPLRQQLKHRFPMLDALICSLREKNTPTGLSHILTRREGKIFIDVMIPKIHHLGCKPNSNHDGIIVPLSYANEVWQLMMETLTDYLGFAPRLNAKGLLVDTQKQHNKSTSSTTPQAHICV